MCDLQKTLHLRVASRFVVGLGGLNYQGVVNGATHVQIFQKQNDETRFLESVFIAEKLSSYLGWVLNMLASLRKKLRNINFSGEEYFEIDTVENRSYQY